MHYMVPWAHPSLQQKLHSDWFSRFCTTHRRVSHNFTMCRYVIPQKLPIPLGGLGPHLTWYLRPTRVIVPNGMSIGSAVLYESQILCYTMHCQWGRKPPKLPLPLGFRHIPGAGPSHGHRQHAQKFRKNRAYGSRDMLADRQTDRQTQTDMPHTHTHAHTHTHTHRRAHDNSSASLPRAK